jgi:F-type H+-transporting ATPase subunit alpha
LLERAAKLSDAEGGGSITALPVIETQAGDISAYIPTNVISITDGQIFLESELFNSGQRPAVNAGLSVSRVGGAAQTKAMKKVAGKIKLELAQYRELAAFSQFGSELDQATQNTLKHGERLMEILKQGQNDTMSMEHQVISIYVVINKYMMDIAVEDIKRFETEFIQYTNENHPRIASSIRETGKLEDGTVAEIEKAITKFKENFKPSN